MKKFVLFNIINLGLIIAYVCLLFLQINNAFVNASLKTFLFCSLCAFLGLSLIVKAAIFKSDSATWFGINLLCNGITILCSVSAQIPYKCLWPTVFSFLALSSGVVAVVFKDLLQFKLLIAFILISVPCYLFSFKVLNTILLFVLALCVSVGMAFVFIKVVSAVFRLSKRRNDG